MQLVCFVSESNQYLFFRLQQISSVVRSYEEKKNLGQLSFPDVRLLEISVFKKMFVLLSSRRETEPIHNIKTHDHDRRILLRDHQSFHLSDFSIRSNIDISHSDRVSSILHNAQRSRTFLILTLMITHRCTCNSIVIIMTSLRSDSDIVTSLRPRAVPRLTFVSFWSKAEKWTSALTSKTLARSFPTCDRFDLLRWNSVFRSW